MSDYTRQLEIQNKLLMEALAKPLMLNANPSITVTDPSQVSAFFVEEITKKESLLREYFEGFKASNQRLDIILKQAKKNGGLVDVKTIEKILFMDASLLSEFEAQL